MRDRRHDKENKNTDVIDLEINKNGFQWLLSKSLCGL